MNRTLLAAVLAVTTSFAIPVAHSAEPTTRPTTAPVQRSTDAAAALAKAERQIAAGLAFLQSTQNDDGGWGDAKEPPAITALALRAFARNGQAQEPAIMRGYEKLLSYQVADGGIYRDLLANYNTSIAISALAAANDAGYAQAIDRAVAYLNSLQWTPETRPEYPGNPSEKTPEENLGKQVVTSETDPFFGGWGYGGRSRGAGRPDLSNTQLALDALHDAGIASNDAAYQRAVKFLSRAQNLRETNDQVWTGNDGGFIYGPSADRTGESMAGEYTDESGRTLRRSYGSMTYAGLKSMLYAGLTKDDPRVKAAVAWIAANWTLDENPGMKLNNPENAKAGLFYYYHTLARAMAARGEPTLTLPDGQVVDWRIELIDKLESIQNPDGSWIGDKRWMENNPVLATAYTVLALEEARDALKRP